MRIAVFTALSAGRYRLRIPIIKKGNVDYIAFVAKEFEDKRNFEHWNIKFLNKEFDGYDNYQGRRYNRIRYKRCKILAHEFLPDYDYSIWIDSVYVPCIDPNIIISELMDDHDLAAFAHPDRICIYREAKICRGSRLDEADIIQSQVDHYKSCEYPENNGLAATGIIVRRHSDSIKEFNKMWMEHVMKYSIRDQLSFDYVAFERKINYKIIPGNYWHGGEINKRYFVRNSK